MFSGFLINDIASSSISEAISLEKQYDKNRRDGLVFCAYEMTNLFKASTSEMVEMFESHDQVLSSMIIKYSSYI
jgi:hypothetical protein